MLANISITCFAASYGVAIALELWGLYAHSRRARTVALVFGAAGILAHTLFLAHRAAAARVSPLSSPFDWYLLAAWTLAVLYLAVAWRQRRAALELFILPLVLGLIAAAQFADQAAYAPVRASYFWGSVHGLFLLLGTVAVMIGFVAGVMYLMQSYRLKHKILPSEGFRLPSLELLEKISSRALIVSVLLVGGGFVSGVILNVIKHRRQHDYVPWTDPVVLALALMFAWQVAAAIFNWTYPAARHGRKVAYLTVASFVFLAIVLAVLLFAKTEHQPTNQVAPTARRMGGKE